MLNSIIDSIKARLYDMKYTPFLSSYLIAWVYFNAKAILIFFDNKLEVLEKIKLLSYANINYDSPLYFALFYVFIFPIFQLIFYYVTMWFKKQMNKIKQKIEKQELLSMEESNSIRYIAQMKQNELDEYIKKSETIKKDYNKFKTQLNNDYNEKEKKLTDSFDTKILEFTNDLQEQLAEYKKDLSEKDTIIKQQVLEIERLRKSNIINSTQNSLSDMVKQSNNQTKQKYTSLISSLLKEDKQIIKLFFENDKEVKDTFKDNNTLQKLNMQKATTEKILRSLISKDILKEESMYVQLTDIGLEMANDLFKENTNA
jgi:hypothetical protein